MCLAHLDSCCRKRCEGRGPNCSTRAVNASCPVTSRRVSWRLGTWSPVRSCVNRDGPAVPCFSRWPSTILNGRARVSRRSQPRAGLSGSTWPPIASRLAPPPTTSWVAWKPICGDLRPFPVSTPPAKWRAPAYTAPIASRATHCSRASFLAPEPRKPCCSPEKPSLLSPCLPLRRGPRGQLQRRRCGEWGHVQARRT